MNTDVERVLQVLKDHLTIEVDFKEAGRAYYDGDHQLTVSLKLYGTVISRSETSLPNRTQERPY